LTADYDVAVIGTGPAGATAARVAAEAGCRTLLLERSAVPRYKCCGGGIVGLSRAALPPGMSVPVSDQVHRITFTKDGRQRYTRSGRGGPVFELVMRSAFDAELVRAACGAGAELWTGVTVRGLAESGGVVTVTTGAEPVRAAVVVGADGTGGRTGGYVGVQCAQVDVGLEGEFPVPADRAGYWSGRVHIDWGPVPGAYAWVFPKGDLLSVGVIGARADGERLRDYYARFVASMGLGGVTPTTFSGHLTRCRTVDSPLRRGRVLVAGDAAGLLEPWTREGISYALRSGALAGAAAAKAACSSGEATAQTALSSYGEQVTSVLGPEMAAGRIFLRAFTANRQAYHGFLASIPGGWQLFTRVVAGETTLADQLRRPAVRMAVAAVTATGARRRRRA
jgi:geranylgeranyl reductase family protein